MNMEAAKTLSHLEKMVGEEKHDPRQKFITVNDACEAYHMCRKTLVKEALEAGAVYRIGKTGKKILINTVIFEKYLETFRIMLPERFRQRR